MSDKGKQKETTVSSDEFAEEIASTNFQSEVEDEYDSDLVIESAKKSYLSQSDFLNVHAMRPEIPKEVDNSFTAEHANPALAAKLANGGSASESSLIHRDFVVPSQGSHVLRPSPEAQAPQRRIRAIPAR